MSRLSGGTTSGTVQGATAARSGRGVLSSLWLAGAFAVTLGGMHTILEGAVWWWFSLLLGILVFGAGGAVRALIGRSGVGRDSMLARVLAPLAAAVVLGAAVCLTFAPRESWLGFIPTGNTIARFSELVRDARYSITWQDVPATVDPPILFLLAAGTGLLALLAEIATFSLRLPALVGLPLLALFLVPGLPPEGATDPAFFVASAVGFFGLLLAGRPRRYVGSLAIGASAIIGALVLPSVLPGTAITPTNNGLGPSVSTGVNPMLRLGDDLRDTEDRVALTYSTVTDSPQYLRLVEVSNFFSLNWGPTQPALDERNRPANFPRPPGLATDVTTRREVTYLHVANLLSPWLPVPYPASSIIGLSGSWQYLPASFTVASNQNLARGEDYTVSSVVLEPTPEQLEASGTRVPGGFGDYLALPPDTPTSIAEKAREVTAGAGSNYERAVAIQEFLRSSPFLYSESAPVSGDYDGTGVDVVATFLDEGRGYCIHFASAMAVMARELGIPSRILVGFQPGSPINGEDEGRKLYEVTTNDLHAWPELYFSGIGWVRFEPTPSRGVVPDYANPQLDGVPTAPDPGTPEGNPGAGGLDPDLPQLDAGPTIAGWLTSNEPSRWIGWLLLTAGLIGLVLLPAGVRFSRRQHTLARLRAGSGSVASAWRELRETAEDLGIVLQATSTPREAVARLRNVDGIDEDCAAALLRIENAVEAAGYGRPDDEAETVLSGLADDVDLVVRSLLAAADPADRWRARLLPQSLLGRAARATRRLA